MKKTNIALACLLVLVVVACTSTSTYKTAATIEATVDTGMKAWADWVKQERAGGADMTAKTAQVRQAYTSYRFAMNTFYDVRSAATGTNVVQQIGSATQAAVDLLNLINQFLPASKQVNTKAIK